jgi:hypothetical protein
MKASFLKLWALIMLVVNMASAALMDDVGSQLRKRYVDTQLHKRGVQGSPSVQQLRKRQGGDGDNALQ